ncbi:MAG: deoxynucleoside kinase [Fibrobacteria bacterium]|nr:deoxynucleoside kinase [Fibrobacteria bacterium]
MKLPKNIRYLAIEGVLGVGKTTLVKYLQQHLKCQTLFEDFQNNPFLENFYQDRAQYAFQTQIVFLLSRHKQIKDSFNQQDLFTPQIVSDYMFAKDKIFASLNLDDNEMALYNKLTAFLEKDLPRPDYVVYLQGNTDTLVERIYNRDRDFERDMDEKYIDALNECYNSYFMHYSDSPVLIINTNNIDFVKNPSDLQLIISQICQAPQGVNYFSPVSGG